MKKTFCDRNGEECVNTTVIVSIRTIHHTRDGQYVGDDEHKPVEICLNCASELEAVIPQAFAMVPKDEMAMMETPVAVDYHNRAEMRR